MKRFGLAIALSSLIFVGSANSASAEMWYEHQFMDGAPVDLTLKNVWRQPVAIPQPPATSAAFASLGTNPWVGTAIHSQVLTHSRVLAPTYLQVPACNQYRPGLYIPGRYSNRGSFVLPRGHF